MTNNLPQLPSITINNIVPDVSITNQDLGQKPPSLPEAGQKDFERIYYERLNAELSNFTNKLGEIQNKTASNEEKINLLHQSYQEFCKNLDEKIDGRVAKKLEEKKFATKEDLKDAEVRLKGQIDEIKSNKKMYIGLIVGAILGFLANTGLLFLKQKFEKPATPSVNSQNIEQSVAKPTK